MQFVDDTTSGQGLSPSRRNRWRCLVGVVCRVSVQGNWIGRRRSLGYLVVGTLGFWAAIAFRTRWCPHRSTPLPRPVLIFGASVLRWMCLLSSLPRLECRLRYRFPCPGTPQWCCRSTSPATASSAGARALAATLFLVVSTLLAAILDDLGVVLSIVGATGSVIVTYILPGFCYWRLCTQPHAWLRRAALAQFCLGVVLMPISLTLVLVNL